MAKLDRQFPLTRVGTHCPMCLKPKDAGLVVHFGPCYRQTRFRDGNPLALYAVEAYETYLSRVSVLLEAVIHREQAP